MPIFVGDTTNGRQAAVLQSTGSTWFGNSSDDVHNFQGDMYITGALKASMGMSGSITKTFGGTSYLVAGSNVTITSSSNGQVTVAASGGSGSPAGSDGLVQYNNNSSFGGAGIFYDDSDGRVGIGTTSPDNTLHVKSAGTTHIKIESEAGYLAALKVKSGGQSSAYVWQPASTSDLRFYVNGDDRMHIDNDGNVGVGTTSPDYTLDIAGDVGLDEYMYHNGDANTFIRFQVDDINIQAGGVDFIKITEDDSQDQIVFNEGSADVDFRVESNSNSHMFFIDGGNNRIGINTSDPGKDLEINNSSGGSIRLTYNDDSGSASNYADISVGANGALTFQTVDSDGAAGHMDFEADGDIVLDVGSSCTLNIKENATSLLLITPSSSNIDFQPQVSGKDIRFASQAGNRLMTLDSSDDAVKIDRRLGMGFDSIMSSATLNANTPIVMVIAGMSDITGTLADPSFAGQIKIVIGLNAGVGDSIVSYKNGAGSTTTKTLVNGTGLILCSFDATGGGALRWIPLGDIS